MGISGYTNAYASLITECYADTYVTLIIVGISGYTNVYASLITECYADTYVTPITVGISGYTNVYASLITECYSNVIAFIGCIRDTVVDKQFIPLFLCRYLRYCSMIFQVYIRMLDNKVWQRYDILVVILMTHYFVFYTDL